MKKNKSKSDRKSSNKEAKAIRKELRTNLSAKFKELIQNLGYEAEAIEKDIQKAGKFLSKKLSGQKVKMSPDSSALIKNLDMALEEVKERHQEPSTTSEGKEAAAAPAEKNEDKPRATRARRAPATAKASAPPAQPTKRRGRAPSKTAPAKTAPPDVQEGADAIAPRRRGRQPRKAENETAPASAGNIKK